MAKISTDELLDAFKEMTLIELSEFVKQFEDTFGVTAAAPVAVAAAAAAAGGGDDAPAEEESDEVDVILESIGDKKIPATVINLNQARRLKDLKDEELTKLLTTHWGQVREGRDPNREQYIASMKALIRKSPGDPLAGDTDRSGAGLSLGLCSALALDVELRGVVRAYADDEGNLAAQPGVQATAGLTVYLGT